MEKSTNLTNLIDAFGNKIIVDGIELKIPIESPTRSTEKDISLQDAKNFIIGIYQKAYNRICIKIKTITDYIRFV